MWIPRRILPIFDQIGSVETSRSHIGDFNNRLGKRGPVPTPPSIPSTHAISEYIADGARIAAILLVWGVIAAFFTYGVSEIGGPGSLFKTLGPQIGALVALAGLLNAVLFLAYRSIDYWNRYT